MGGFPLPSSGFRTNFEILASNWDESVMCFCRIYAESITSPAPLIISLILQNNYNFTVIVLIPVYSSIIKCFYFSFVICIYLQ